MPSGFLSTREQAPALHLFSTAVDYSNQVVYLSTRLGFARANRISPEKAKAKY
jgi:hypothetical protein